MDNQSITNADCGTGAGGFKPGNTCASEDGVNLPEVGSTVKIDGNTYIAESFDSDDTFPPAIAHYEIKNGHIVYTARNGSEGVVTGTKKESEKWIKDVEKEIKSNPPEQSKTREWVESDGGKENIRAAKEMVSKAASTFGITPPETKVFVAEKSLVSGEHGEGSISLINPHKQTTSSLNFKSSVSHEIHIAAHETMHRVFSEHPEVSKKFQDELSKAKQTVSLYHSLGGHFEGLMDLGAAYVHSPESLKKYSPELYDIADRWVKEVKSQTTNTSVTLVINSLRYVDVNGREFAVASIRILRPQVLEGSKGKLYYPPDEISKDYDRWNGMPMVVYHPNKDGKNISARHPEVMQKQEVGRIYNARITSDHELDVEGWFDVELTKKVDARVWKNLQEGRPIEVSTGLFTKDEPAPLNSKYKDKEYTHVARNYNPDHLAILPDQVGACSLKDGCGVFTVNGDASYTYNSVPSSFTVNPSWVVDEALWEKAKQAATEEGKPEDYALITEIYKRMGGAINNTDDSQQDNSNTQTTGNTMDRTKSVDWLVANCDCYKNVTGAKDVLLKMNVDQYATVFTNNAKEAIENEDSKFFDWMNNASDDIKGAFVKMIKNKIIRQTGNEFPPVKGKEEEKKTEVPPVEESEEEKKKKAAMLAEQQGAATNRRLTEEQYIASLPPSLQEVLNNAKQVTEREKTRLVNTLTQHITDNTQKANAQKVLMTKTLPDLQERVALMPPVPKSQQQVNNQHSHQPDAVNDFYPSTPDYLGAAGYPTGNTNDGYDINKDILDTGPTFNWAQMSKESMSNR